MKTGHISETVEGLKEPATTPQTTQALRIDKFDLRLKPVGIEEDDKKIKNAVDSVRKFMRDVETRQKPYWLTIWGRSGSGKTTLATRAMKYWQETAKWVICGKTGANMVHRGDFWSWPKLMKEIHDDYSIMDDLVEDVFLVLDDIGADRDRSGFGVDKLHLLLDERLGKWTIVTTNLSPKDIASKLDPRIISRMLRGGNRVIDLDITDYNLRGK